VYFITTLKKNILFVINPVSGGKDKHNFPELARQNIDPNMFDIQFVYSDAIGHAHSLAADAVKGDTDIVVSVGGDGTMNEIASAMADSGKPLAIVPYGSGNGLARTLKIPMDHKKAIQRINKLQITTIDSGHFNSKKFFNMAGMGFDATISSRFAKDKTRGLQGYVRTTLQEIAGYKPQNYRIEIDGKVYEREAFMLSVANSSQYGNNAHISPKASVYDGLLDVCIIRPFPLYLFPVLGFRMFNNTADKSSYVEILRGKSINIIRETPGPIHLDGEPDDMGTEIKIEVKPLSLQTLV
jgi:diacylglycerol kinase (ATP)